MVAQKYLVELGRATALYTDTRRSHGVSVVAPVRRTRRNTIERVDAVTPAHRARRTSASVQEERRTADVKTRFCPRIDPRNSRYGYITITPPYTVYSVYGKLARAPHQPRDYNIFLRLPFSFFPRLIFSVAADGARTVSFRGQYPLV